MATTVLIAAPPLTHLHHQADEHTPASKSRHLPLRPAPHPATRTAPGRHVCAGMESPRLQPCYPPSAPKSSAPRPIPPASTLAAAHSSQFLPNPRRLRAFHRASHTFHFALRSYTS